MKDKFKLIVLVYNKFGLLDTTFHFKFKTKTDMFKEMCNLINKGYTQFNIRGI